MKTILKFLLKKSLRFRWGEWFYRKLTKSYPYTVNNRIEIIRRIGKEFNIPIFIETGTYLGDTVQGVKGAFEASYSCEIEPNFADFCRRRFEKDGNVFIQEGDSVYILTHLISFLKSRALFFLDAHFSGGISGKGEKNTPIEDELSVIGGSEIKDNIILVDDARLFNGTNGYPTIDKIEHLLWDINPQYNIELKDGFIMATVK